MYLKITLILTFEYSVYSLQPSITSITISNEPKSIYTSQFESTDLQSQLNGEEVSDWRIVGGHDCFVEEHPFLVSIRMIWNLQYVCAGSLLTIRYVLTVAHCFATFLNEPEFLKVVVGSSTLRRTKRQELLVDNILRHEGFDNDTLRNDISMLRLAQDVILYPGAVDIVKLPTRVLPDDLSQVCDPDSFTVAGWGDKRPYGVHETPPPFEESPQLQCVKLPYITNEKCRAYLGREITEKVICTLPPKGGKDACQGDSGAPLFCEGVQYGIMSWGLGCAARNSPGVYTRVDRHLDFINRNLKSRSSKGCGNNAGGGNDACQDDSGGALSCERDPWGRGCAASGFYS